MVTCAVIAATTTAYAQSNFLDKAKGVLGDTKTTLPGDSGLPGTSSKPKTTLGTGSLTDGEIGSGLREALRVGTKRVVSQVGRNDGYNADPAIHLPLPGTLRKVQTALRKVGKAEMADDLELRLNRAAEAAAPEAQELFVNAIGEMSLEDVRKIYEGPKDSATRYFQGKMTSPLAERMKPIVDKSLARVGAIRSYDDMMAQYKALPFVPDAKANLTKYVVEKAMNGIFLYVAKEEEAIRTNPAARTTAILQRVFGSS